MLLIGQCSQRRCVISTKGDFGGFGTLQYAKKEEDRSVKKKVRGGGREMSSGRKWLHPSPVLPLVGWFVCCLGNARGE